MKIQNVQVFFNSLLFYFLPLFFVFIFLVSFFVCFTTYLLHCFLLSPLLFCFFFFFFFLYLYPLVLFVQFQVCPSSLHTCSLNLTIVCCLLVLCSRFAYVCWYTAIRSMMQTVPSMVFHFRDSLHFVPSVFISYKCVCFIRLCFFLSLPLSLR